MYSSVVNQGLQLLDQMFALVFQQRVISKQKLHFGMLNLLGYLQLFALR